MTGPDNGRIRARRLWTGARRVAHATLTGHRAGRRWSVAQLDTVPAAGPLPSWAGTWGGDRRAPPPRGPRPVDNVELSATMLISGHRVQHGAPRRTRRRAHLGFIHRQDAARLAVTVPLWAVRSPRVGSACSRGLPTPWTVATRCPGTGPRSAATLSLPGTSVDSAMPVTRRPRVEEQRCPPESCGRPLRCPSRGPDVARGRERSPSAGDAVPAPRGSWQAHPGWSRSGLVPARRCGARCPRTTGGGRAPVAPVDTVRSSVQ